MSETTSPNETTAFLDRMEERHQATPQGPWRASGSQFLNHAGTAIGQVWTLGWRRTLDYIIGTHADLPALIALARHQHAALDAVRQMCARGATDPDERVRAFAAALRLRTLGTVITEEIGE